MKTSWKVFKVANIVEVIIISSIITTAMYTTPLPLNGYKDFIIFAFVCSIPIMIAINCVDNILLANYQRTGRNLSLGKKIFFWSFSGLFFGTLILILLGLFNLYFIYKSQSIYAPLSTRQQVIFGAMLLFFLNGLYIFVAQIILFKQVRKKYVHGNLSIIEEIGIKEPDKT